MENACVLATIVCANKEEQISRTQQDCATFQRIHKLLVSVWTYLPQLWKIARQWQLVLWLRWIVFEQISKPGLLALGVSCRWRLPEPTLSATLKRICLSNKDFKQRMGSSSWWTYKKRTVCNAVCRRSVLGWLCDWLTKDRKVQELNLHVHDEDRKWWGYWPDNSRQYCALY